MYTLYPVAGSWYVLASPYWLTPPPVASPTSVAFVDASTSATKFPAAENVARPISTNRRPRRFTFGSPQRTHQRAVRRVVTAAVQADVHDHPCAPRAARETQQPLGGVVRRALRRVVADIHDPTTVERRHPQVAIRAGEVQRSRASRQRRRIVPVMRVGEPADEGRGRHRVERQLGPAATVALDRERRRPGTLEHAEPREHLRGDDVLRCETAKARRVVVRDERCDPREQRLDGDPGDRDHARTDERPVERVHHERPFRERVQAHREQVQLSPMLSVPREDPGVAVARAGERGHAHQRDQQLILVERRCRARRRVDRRREPRARDLVEHVRMNRAQLLRQRTNVAGRTGHRPRDRGSTPRRLPRRPALRWRSPAAS